MIIKPICPYKIKRSTTKQNDDSRPSGNDSTRKTTRHIKHN